MKKIIKLSMIFVMLGIMAGCMRTALVAQKPSQVSGVHTVAEVRDAILKAGNTRQWAMKEVTPGVIDGHLQVRSHIVDVQIPYTASGYSIDYVGSQNMKAGNGMIHRKYNNWVRNLDSDIQINLSSGLVK